MDITREEIRNLLKEAIEPLERKTDNLNNGFEELKRFVDFVNAKYDDILVQLKQANEKIQRQGTSLKQIRKDLDDATKQAQDTMNGFENLAEYLRAFFLRSNIMFKRFTRDKVQISSKLMISRVDFVQNKFNLYQGIIECWALFENYSN